MWVALSCRGDTPSWPRRQLRTSQSCFTDSVGAPNRLAEAVHANEIPTRQRVHARTKLNLEQKQAGSCHDVTRCIEKGNLVTILRLLMTEALSAIESGYTPREAVVAGAIRNRTQRVFVAMQLSAW